MSEASKLIDDILSGKHKDDVLEKDIHELTTSGGIATRYNVKPKKVDDLEAIKNMVKGSDTDMYASLRLLKAKTKDGKKQKQIEKIIEQHNNLSRLIEEIE